MRSRMDRASCVALYGNAFGVQHRGGFFGWFPTMEEALAAAKAEGVTFGTGIMVPAKMIHHKDGDPLNNNPDNLELRDQYLRCLKCEQLATIGNYCVEHCPAMRDTP